jgi:hypothetical protein
VRDNGEVGGAFCEVDGVSLMVGAGARKVPDLRSIF